jgi:hypothetical protein
MRQGQARLALWRLGAESLVEWLVAGIVLGAALGLGGLHVHFSVALSGLATLACVCAVWRVGLTPRTIPLPSLIAFGLAGYTTLQAVPLPLAWTRALSPHAAEVWTAARGPLEAPLTWAPLSYDPGASAVEAARWFGYGCLFLAAVTIGKRRGARWGATLLFFSSLLIAVITFAHGLLGAERVYGVYTPTFAPSRWHIGPLLNPNTLAGYLNLGAFCGLGLALSRRASAPRWVIGSGVALLIGVGLLSGSRGGVVLLPVGLALIVVLRSRLQKAEGGRGQLGVAEWLVLTAPVAGGIVLAVLGSSSMTWRELAQRNIDKIQMVGWARPLLKDHAWFGVGRGAFESVFQQYRAGPDNLIYSHPENLVIQWLSEWGLVVGGLGLVGMAFALRFRQLGVNQQSAAIGVAVGSLLVVLQNLVDLSLEVPAMPLALAAGLGACWGGANSRSWRPPRVALSRASLLFAGCTAVLLAHALGRGLNPVAQNRLDVHEQLETTNLKDPQAVNQLRQALAAAALRHPGEPYFPRLRAVLALQLGDEPVLKWIDQALTLSPWSGRTHLILGTALARNGPAHQALLELRLAAQYDPGLAVDVGRIAVSITKVPASLERAAPPGGAGARVLFAAAERMTDPSDVERRSKLLDLSVQRDGGFVQARRALLEHLLKSCLPQHACAELFERHVQALEAAAPTSALPLEYRARGLEKLGRLSEAEATLAQNCPRYPERARCLDLRLRYASRLRDSLRTAEAAKAVVSDACENDRCVPALLDAGRALETNGQLLPALAYFERAAADQPNAQTLGSVGRVALALGLYTRADAALTRAARMRGADPKALADLQEKRHKAWVKDLEKPAAPDP